MSSKRSKKGATHAPKRSAKRGGNGKVTLVNRGPTPWPTRFETKLNYTDEFDVTVTAGVMNVYTFNANALFDPDQTGTGHQPLGFDQYAVQYSRYRVLNVSYTAYMSNPATAQGHCRVAFKFVNGSSIPARPAMYEVQLGDETTVGTSGAPPAKVAGHFDLTKLNADPAKYRIDDRYSALTTGNPTEVMYLHGSLYSNVAFTGRWIVKLRYLVEFYDNETPAASIFEMLTRDEEYAAIVKAYWAEKTMLVSNGLWCQEKQIALEAKLLKGKSVAQESEHYKMLRPFA